MAKKSLPVTVRLEQSDLDFLGQMQIPGCTTLSEKMRAIVSQARQQASAGTDRETAIQMADTWMAGFRKELAAASQEKGLHSPFLESLVTDLPALLAVLIATNGQADNVLETEEQAFGSYCNLMENGLIALASPRLAFAAPAADADKRQKRLAKLVGNDPTSQTNQKGPQHG